MSKNQVVKTFDSNDSWIAPAGVSFIQIFSKPSSSERQSGLFCGNNQTFALSTNGTAYGWGNNQQGEVGNGTNSNSFSSPVAVLGNIVFSQIDGGEEVAMGIDGQGQAWAWGANGGTLGNGATADRSSPVQVVGGIKFKQVSIGQTHAGGVDVNGVAWMWGQNNGDGQLGDGTTVGKSSPVQVLGGHIFTAISVNGDHTLAIDDSGQVWAWGSNQDGQLGDGTIISKSSPVAVLGGHIAVQISAGSGNGASNTDGNSGLLDDAGNIWMWGSGNSGRLGNGINSKQSSPIMVIGGHTWKYFSNSGVHAIAIDSNNVAWAWGTNQDGCLGDGTNTSRSSPVQVLGGFLWNNVSAGSNAGVNTGSSGGSTVGGALYTWGTGQAGRLGDNTIVSKSSPVAVVGGISSQLNAVSYSSLILPVVPGQSYSLEFGSNYAKFGGNVILNEAALQILLIYQA